MMGQPSPPPKVTNVCLPIGYLKAGQQLMREAQENKVYKIVQCVDKLDMPMIGDMFDYCCYVSNVNWQRVQVIDWPWFWRKKYVWCVTFTLKQETERLRVVIQKKSEHIVSPTEHGTYDAVVERDSEERQSWR